MPRLHDLNDKKYVTSSVNTEAHEGFTHDHNNTVLIVATTLRDNRSNLTDHP